MKGIFDNTSNKQYNDAVPNYDANDGIDSVKCDNTECMFRDTELGRCLFEVCIHNQFPYSIPFHQTFTTKCRICNGDMKYEFEDTITHHPLISLDVNICDKCISKLKSIVLSGDDKDE
jgi:hypothetical protein